jgi:hypothetical protein
VPFASLDATLGAFGVDANAFDFASFDAAFAGEDPSPRGTIGNYSSGGASGGGAVGAAVLPATVAPRLTAQHADPAPGMPQQTAICVPCVDCTRPHLAHDASACTGFGLFSGGVGFRCLAHPMMACAPCSLRPPPPLFVISGPCNGHSRTAQGGTCP